MAEKSKKYFKNGSYISYIIMFLLMYMAMGVLLELATVFLLESGMTATKVSIIIAISLICATIFQTPLGNLNDKYDKRIVSSILIVISSVLSFVLPFVKSFVLITIVYSAMTVITYTLLTVSENVATDSTFKYGKLRIWGTIGYGIGIQLGGLVYNSIGHAEMFFFSGVCLLLSSIGLLGTKPVSLENPSKEIEFENSKGRSNSYLTPKLVLYLLIFGIAEAITFVTASFTAPTLQFYGLDVGTCSTIMFMASLFEIPVVLFGGKVINKMKNGTLLLIYFGLKILLYYISGFVDSLVLKSFFIILFKTSISMAVVMINLKILTVMVDEKHRLTALALSGAVRSGLIVIVQTFSGPIIDNYGYPAFYLEFILLCVLGAILTIICRIPNKENLEVF